MQTVITSSWTRLVDRKGIFYLMAFSYKNDDSNVQTICSIMMIISAPFYGMFYVLLSYVWRGLDRKGERLLYWDIYLDKEDEYFSCFEWMDGHNEHIIYSNVLEVINKHDLTFFCILKATCIDTCTTFIRGCWIYLLFMLMLYHN